MNKIITTRASDATTMVEAAWQIVWESFDRFCLTAGIASLTQMMEEDSERLCGPRHGRSDQRAGHRYGPRGGWASTVGRSRSSGLVCVDGTAVRWACRAGRPRGRKIGSANGR